MIRQCDEHPGYSPSVKPETSCLNCWTLWLGEMMGISLPPNSGLRNSIIQALEGCRQAYVREQPKNE